MMTIAEAVFSLQAPQKLYKQDNFWLSELSGTKGDTKTCRQQGDLISLLLFF
jgi:hypothetical protein